MGRKSKALSGLKSPDPQNDLPQGDQVEGSEGFDPLPELTEENAGVEKVSEKSSPEDLQKNPESGYHDQVQEKVSGDDLSNHPKFAKFKQGDK